MAKKVREVEMVPYHFITVENLMHYDKVKAYLDKEKADEYFLTQEEADALYLAIDGHITLTEEQKEELRGKDGKDGKDGQNGIFFTPVISEDFVLTWTNNGDLDNPDPIDLKGKDGKDGVYLGIVEHEKTASDTVAELAPNEVYKFPAMATLTITLGTGTSMFDEYHFFFTSGATATVLSIPAEISVPDDFEVEANMRYEISIAENILIYLARDIAVQTEGSGGEA